jgi:beta-glucosidase
LHDSRKPGAAEGGPITPFSIKGIRVGAFPVFSPDQAIEDAAALAKKCDKAVIVCGLNSDWESEGYDRPNLLLPLRQNELITRVAEANPNTIVVIQAGSAVSMPWIDKVAGVVFAWYGGNETGNSIADIVYGKVNPSGRLPISLPVREEDIAASLNYKSAHTARKIAPLFPFGHGLSYTTFEYSDLKITSKPSDNAKPDDWKLKVAVTVTNTGKIAGSHSVHFYTSPPKETATSLKHPEHALQAFDKIYDLEPGAKKTVEVTLDKCKLASFSYFKEDIADKQTPSLTGTMSTTLSGSKMENGRSRSVQTPRPSLDPRHSS